MLKELGKQSQKMGVEELVGGRGGKGVGNNRDNLAVKQKQTNKDSTT